MNRDKGHVRFLGRSADRPQRRFSRGVSLLPSLFTMANLFCGYACVVYAMRGEYETAAPFIGFAIVLDMLDGRIARLTGTSTDFGLQFDSLADVVSFCRASDARKTGKASAAAEYGQATPAAMNHGEACSPDLVLGRVSAFLLQLSPGARPEDVKFALAQLADVKIVEGNTVLTSSRQALSTLLIGIAVFTAFQLMALLILVSLLFSAIVQERYREVGLLRAMGAQSGQVMTVILAEAAIITGLGGLAGLGFGTALLLLFNRSLGFYFGLLGVPFSWPPLAVLQVAVLAALVFSAVLGLVGAFLPAWRVRRMAPYALIQTEGR